MASMAFRLACLLLVLLSGSRGHSFETEEITNKKQTTDHFLQHLVNSVNKLMVQHAVDMKDMEHKLKMIQRPVDVTSLVNKVNKQQIQHDVDTTKLESKLHKEHEDMHKLIVKHAVDINNMEHKLQKQQEEMNKQKKNSTEDINNVEKKHKMDMQRMENKHTEDIKKIEKTYTESIERIQKKNAEDIERIQKKNADDMAKTGEELMNLNDAIQLKQDKKEHSDDIEKLETKHAINRQKLEKKHSDDLKKLQNELEIKITQEKNKQTGEINKVATKCSGDIKELKNEVDTKRTADLRKEASEMSAIRTKHGYDMQRLEKKLNDNINKPGNISVQPVIGFDVGYATSMSSGSIIPFNSIRTNIGNAWNRASHMFTAPVKGLYSFTLSVMTGWSSSSQYLAYAYIKRGNGSILRYVQARRNTNIQAHIPATGTVVVMLNAGETVYAQRVSGYLYSGYRTTFAGFLIQKSN